ncbi:MAG: hypothetical protein GYB24_01225 [Rhodobacteraceae bacterium]|nr:hypothetical protein [Paracoccaceae bacterium]
MTVPTVKRVLFCGIAAALTAPMPVLAQSGAPQGPPIAKIASALDVSSSALEKCMPRPAKGARPSRPDAAAIASCLKSDNASVTEKMVDRVLKENQPERPARS